MNGHRYTREDRLSERVYLLEKAEAVEDFGRSLDAASTPRESYAIRWTGVTYPACNDGPCKQGDGICPTPDACRLPIEENDEPTPFFGPVMVGLALAVAMFAALTWQYL